MLNVPYYIHYCAKVCNHPENVTFKAQMYMKHLNILEPASSTVVMNMWPIC